MYIVGIYLYSSYEALRAYYVLHINITQYAMHLFETLFILSLCLEDYVYAAFRPLGQGLNK